MQNLNLAYLKQPSTWSGLIISISSIFGLQFQDNTVAQISMLISTVVGIYEMFRNEKLSRD